MADSGLVATLISNSIGSVPLPDEGVVVMAVFRPGDAADAFLRLLRARMDRAGYVQMQSRVNTVHGDVANTAVLISGRRTAVPPAQEHQRRLDAPAALVLSQALARLAQDYFFSEGIQDGADSIGRAVIVVAHLRRQQVVPTFVQEELPSQLAGFRLARVVSEGLGGGHFDQQWSVFALQLEAAA